MASDLIVACELFPTETGLETVVEAELPASAPVVPEGVGEEFMSDIF
jgi:hypothetical protein